MELLDRDDRDDDAEELLAALLLLLLALLIEVAGDPPDLDAVPADYWLTFQTQIADMLAEILLLTFVASALQHGAESVEQAAEAGIGWAVTTASEIALGVVQTTRRMFERLTAKLLVDEDVDEFNEGVADAFGTTRANVLAVDAVTRGQTAGGEWALAIRDGISPDDEWSTVGDDRVCPICQPLDGLPRSEWSISVPSGPPAHAMCRCAIVYANL